MQVEISVGKHGCSVHAYALMTNQVHLLRTPHYEQSLGKAMQMLGRYYVLLQLLLPAHLSDLVVPLPEHLRLGESNGARQTAYRELFKHHIPEISITEIREATNKAWVLDNDQFKQRIQEQSGRRVKPKARGVDRKSKQFNSNRVVSFGSTTAS